MDARQMEKFVWFILYNSLRPQDFDNERSHIQYQAQHYGILGSDAKEARLEKAIDSIQEKIFDKLDYRFSQIMRDLADKS